MGISKLTSRRFPVSQRTFKEICVEFSNNTTIHGIKEFAFDDHPNLKLGWCILFLLCSVATVICVQAMYKEYMQGPTASTVQHVLPDKFPAVLFCPKTWINQTTARGLGMDMELVKFLVFMSWINLVWYEGDKAAHAGFNFTRAREKYEVFRQNNPQLETIHDIYLAIALDPYHVISRDVPLECELQSVEPVVRASSVCYRVSFFQHNETMDYFMNVNCFIYDIPNDAWPKMDLSEVDVGVPELENAVLSDNGFSSAYPAYYPTTLPYHRVYIGDDAYAKYSENDYPIHAGESFMMKIRASVQSTLTCTPHTNFTDKLACTLVCRKNIVESAYGCAFFFGFRNDSNVTEYCSLRDDVKTLDDVLSLGNVSDDSNSLDDCYSSCKSLYTHIFRTPCEQWTYDPIILPTGNMEGNECGDDGTSVSTGSCKGWMLLEFRNYFSSISINETSTYSALSLLSNVGGMLSLFTGASFISLCQIIYHFLLRQICPHPKTVQKFRRSISGSVISHATIYREEVKQITQKLPFWKRQAQAAKVRLRKIGQIIPFYAEEDDEDINHSYYDSQPDFDPGDILEVIQAESDAKDSEKPKRRKATVAPPTFHIHLPSSDESETDTAGTPTPTPAPRRSRRVAHQVENEERSPKLNGNGPVFSLDGSKNVRAPFGNGSPSAVPRKTKVSLPDIIVRPGELTAPPKKFSMVLQKNYSPTVKRKQKNKLSLLSKPPVSVATILDNNDASTI